MVFGLLNLFTRFSCYRNKQRQFFTILLIFSVTSNAILKLIVDYATAGENREKIKVHKEMCSPQLNEIIL
jgi:hypothetical protein